MKNLFAFIFGLILLSTGCHKDAEKPMTDKQFEKMVNRNFGQAWAADVIDHNHKSLNAKSHAFAGITEPAYNFKDKDASYTFTYDTLVNNDEYTVTESGNYTIDYANRQVQLFPTKIVIEDPDKNVSNLNARCSRFYVISVLSSEDLYLKNFFKVTVTVVNSEGVSVEQLQDASETVFFNADKKC